MTSLPGEAVVCVVDDEEQVRSALSNLLRSGGFAVLSFASPQEFLDHGVPDRPSCLVLDVRLQEQNGMDFQIRLRDQGIGIPIVLMTGHGDIPMSVRGMKAGAVDFLAKPFGDDEMLAAVDAAVDADRQRRDAADGQARLRTRFAALTLREREVMALVAAGLMNKQVAARLSISEITVKIHRGNAMRKMKAQSLADLVRMAEILDIRDAAVARFRAQARVPSP